MPSVCNSVPTLLRTVGFRLRPATLQCSRAVMAAKRPACRSFAASTKEDPPTSQEEVKGPNMAQAEHVSEEAAKMAKIQGGEGPDVEGQGTPVQDILRAEKKTRDNAPEVMQEDVKQGGTTKPSTRTFSTLARRAAVTPFAGVDAADQFNPSTIPSAAQQAGYADELSAASNIELPVDSTSTVSDPGHKFPLPSLPLPREHVKDYRYDPVVTQITHLLMKDGKKSVAQRNMAVILNILRTSPAPRYDPSRPLLPGAPPASHLPLNPSLYLTLAIDSVAPLLRIRSQRGAAGGGVALQIPVPLSLQQRRRTAFMWVLDSVSKKRSRSSGRDMFAQRVAEELISIVEGRSSVWEKRLGVHKIATTARANLKFGRRKR